MSKDVTKSAKFSPIVIEEKTLNEMQEIINNCTPIISSNTQTFTDSVVIANGMMQLREFMNLPDVKKMVESMANTEVGFLTDRPPGKDRWDNRKKKYVKVIPYDYQEIVDALIPPMLEGYRFTGNEINIISYKGMPVKKGKFRKINDFKGVTDFNHSIGTPHKEYFDNTKETGVAKMKCQASWRLDGNPQTLGHDDDVCIIAVEFDKYSGIDKMIGLADSKVFSRVLTRLTGKFTIESEGHFENQDTIVINPKKEDTKGDEKRPLPKKKETKPSEEKPTEEGTRKNIDGEEPVWGDFLMPEDEVGLRRIYDAIHQTYPEKQSELTDYLTNEPIENRPVDFYQDFIDGLKRIVGA